MAHATGGTPSSVMADLLSRGHEFSFVQVMRIARNHLGQAGEQDLPEIPWQDRVRIRPELSLAFPAADVARVEQDGDLLRVTTTFLGLYGTSSPLPNFYTEDLLGEAADDETVFRDFLDIIHQRLYHLYFKCWSKYRLPIRIVEENNPIDRERLLCLIGLGERELAASVPEAGSLLRYTGILTQYPRSASGLKTILRDALQLKNIRIVQNVKRMVKIPNDQRMRLGLAGCRLGIDTVLGSHMADCMGMFGIEIGPLSWQEFNDFLPGTDRYQQLTRYTRFYLIDPLAVELRLSLAAGEAKPVRLGDPKARLGLNTWCFAGDGIGEVGAAFQVPAFPFKTPSEQSVAHNPSANTGCSLADYYQQERTALGELASRFVEEHENLAPLMSGPMADPGIERLLEGTAFLNALLQRKLDDDFPEFIHEVMNALDPNALRPVPATTVVAFAPKEGLVQTQRIPSGAELLSKPVDGTKCRFRTSFDVVVHPLIIKDAFCEQPAGKSSRITLRLQLNGITLSGWRTKSLRLFLADEHSVACDLYLVLMRYLKRIQLTSHDNGATFEIPAHFLKPVGFAQDETLFAKENLHISGHRLLEEYFLFGDKFLFIELFGLERCATLGSGSSFDIRFELHDALLFAPRVSAKSFVLSATPAINLFPHKALPVQGVTSEPLRQKIVPVGDKRGHFHIYSVERVTGMKKSESAKVLFAKHGDNCQVLSHDHVCRISHAASAIGNGLDTFIDIPARKGGAGSSRMKLDMDLMCTNGKLPELLAIGDLCMAAEKIPEFVEAANIKAVTGACLPEPTRNRQWRYFSGYSLNSISINSVENLQAILRHFANSTCLNQQVFAKVMKKIEAIESVDAKPADRLIGRSTYRGYDIRLRLRGYGFDGPGDLYLFSAVLERFFGGYVTRNCFVRLVVEEIGKGYRFEWPARLGDRDVV